MKTNTQRAITAKMLMERLRSVARETHLDGLDELDLHVCIHDATFALTTDNFQVDEEGNLTIAPPESWARARNAVRNFQALKLNLRIAQVLGVGTLLVTQVIDGQILDYRFEELTTAVLDKEARNPSLDALTEVCEAIRNEVYCDVDGIHGLAVELATPVRHYQSPTLYSTCWTVSHNGWVYAQTLEEAWHLGMEWQQSMAERDLATAFPFGTGHAI